MKNFKKIELAIVVMATMFNHCDVLAEELEKSVVREEVKASKSTSSKK